jgi:DNA polymerase-4
MRWYLHVDMDAFFVSVERALDPVLRDKAVIVGGTRARGVVTSASYEARKYGVCSGMPGYQARRLCPNAIFLPTRHDLYREFSDKIFAILHRYSPIVHKLSIDEGLVDLTGTERLWGLPLHSSQEILLRLRRELGLPASGGLSGNPMIAKVVAGLAKPSGLAYVPHGSEEALLSPLPVAAIPGIGPKSENMLLQQGLRTVGSLLRRDDFRQRFLRPYDQARETGAGDHSIGAETTLEVSLSDLSSMERVLGALVEEIGGRLRDEGVRACRITIKIRYDDFKTVTRSHTIGVPTCFDREILAVARWLLRKNLVSGKKVRLLGVNVGGLRASGWQESLFNFSRRHAWENLYRSIDCIRQRYGDHTIAIASSRAKEE